MAFVADAIHQGAVEVVIGGRIIAGPWMGFSGGAVVAEGNGYFPGHMQSKVVPGGRPSTENITVRQTYRRDAIREAHEFVKSQVGKPGQSVTRLYLDVYGNAYDRGDTYSGVLIHCGPPEYSSEDDDRASWELQFEVAGP